MSFSRVIVEVAPVSSDTVPELLSYGSYLRVPELLQLQTPVGDPPVHDEMLFIVLQQAQELWFKQVLYDLHAVIAALSTRDIPEAVRLLTRINNVFAVLSAEVEVMETLSPVAFTKFRGLLTPSSGFESEQFRELEFASGLRGETFLRLVSRILDLDSLAQSWPVTLHDAFISVLRRVSSDPIELLVRIYREPSQHFELFSLAEALSSYEMRFLEWRFHHVALVERIIGNHSPGTGGSSGTGYLSRTLSYRFFPELWAARDRISEGILPLEVVGKAAP